MTPVLHHRNGKVRRESYLYKHKTKTITFDGHSCFDECFFGLKMHIYM